jgi:hypothetical protein
MKCELLSAVHIELDTKNKWSINVVIHSLPSATGASSDLDHVKDFVNNVMLSRMHTLTFTLPAMHNGRLIGMPGGVKGSSSSSTDFLPALCGWRRGVPNTVAAYGD